MAHNLQTLLEIAKIDIQEMYEIVSELENELSEEENILFESCQEGIFIKIPIEHIIKKYYQEYPSSKKTKVMGHGKFDLTVWNEEIRKRKAILRRIIENHVKDDDILKAR